MPDRIEHIIEEAARRELSGEERRELEEWLASHPGERDVRDLWHYLEAGRIIRRYRAIDERKAWAKVDQRTTRRAAWALRVGRWRWWAAAAVILPLAIGIFWGISRWGVDSVKPVAVQEIKGGEPKAFFEMADGKVISLEENQLKDIVSSSGIPLAKDSVNTLVVKAEKREVSESCRIWVPQGGEYQVVLADGTRVWINSESELRFPSVFTKAERVVELVGEAYFEVAKDECRPFFVQAGDVRIRVLGTSFNVTSYPERERIETTLEQGRIQITNGKEQINVVPGKQVVYNKKNNRFEVKVVDTKLYTSWKDGYYKFDQMTLEEIMETLALWYDLNVFYANAEVKSLEFTGRLRRYDRVEGLFKKIEQTDLVEFELNGKNVVIRKK